MFFIKNIFLFFINKSINLIQIYFLKWGALVDKYNKFKNNKIIVDNKEHRGGHNKFFNYNDELNLFNYFKDNFINKNELLCDEIIKIKAVEESKILYPTKLF